MATKGATPDLRPNIILLLADDQSVLATGSYGNTEVHTPEMDRLGRDGVTFDQHYNTTAICMASRASIMTGLYEYRTGCNFGMGDLPERLWQQSYPVRLREYGYFTAFAGKFGFEVEERGLCEEDFDLWGGGPGQTHYETARNASMRAPLMIYDPRSASAGRQARSPALTGNIDLAPTILELAGIPVPESMDGRSLLPLLDTPKRAIREQMAFMNIWGPEPTTSLKALTADWKYTYWWYADDEMTPAEELYDLTGDPLELKNLASEPEYRAQLHKMRAIYDQELARWQAMAEPSGPYAPFDQRFIRPME